MNFFQQNYLMDYGYLPKSDRETGNLRTEDQLIIAIKELQRMGHIKQTGHIDDATRELLRRPRCGQSDDPLTSDFSATNRFRRRNKRFVIQGPKWDHPNLTWR